MDDGGNNGRVMVLSRFSLSLSPMTDGLTDCSAEVVMVAFWHVISLWQTLPLRYCHSSADKRVKFEEGWRVGSLG